MNESNKYTVVVGKGNVTLEQIIDVAAGRARVEISDDEDFSRRINGSRDTLFKAMENGVPVYGVTTGYGKSCGKRMAMEVALKNGANLLRFHGCGTGEPLGIEETRAAIFTRILCFSRAYSGVSMTSSQMAAFLNGNNARGACRGSRSARRTSLPCRMSPPLCPASAKCLPWAESARPAITGRTQEIHLRTEGAAGYHKRDLDHDGIACMVVSRTRKIIEAAIAATGLTIHALKGNAHHYHPTISKAKPHPGQDLVARTILELLEANIPHGELEADELETLQDPYSVRCCPQIVGVLVDSMDWITRWVEIEANSNNDNPICDPDTGEVLMGGNFYGGHIVFAMDSIKAALASVADMCDRQTQLLVNPNVNRGLPADLVRMEGSDRLYNHGFKAMSIAASALAAEALKASMPASVFSRSTESHNQDKVSMGTIGARDAARVCQLVERTVAVHMLAAAQACDIRGKIEHRPRLNKIHQSIRSIADPNLQDRPMDSDIEKMVGAIATGGIFI